MLGDEIRLFLVPAYQKPLCDRWPNDAELVVPRAVLMRSESALDERPVVDPAEATHDVDVSSREINVNDFDLFNECIPDALVDGAVCIILNANDILADERDQVFADQRIIIEVGFQERSSLVLVSNLRLGQISYYHIFTVQSICRTLVTDEETTNNYIVSRDA